MIIKFRHSAHVALWDWLARNPKALKEEWPGFQIEMYWHVRHNAHCFACEYTIKTSNTKHDICNYCTLFTEKPCLMPGQPYWFWTNFRDDLDLRVMMAKRIRDWPVKEGVICY